MHKNTVVLLYDLSSELRDSLSREYKFNGRLLTHYPFHWQEVRTGVPEMDHKRTTSVLRANVKNIYILYYFINVFILIKYSSGVISLIILAYNID